MIDPRPGAAISSAIFPSRIRKHWSAGSPSRNMNVPSRNRTFAAHPASRARYSGSRLTRNGCSRSSGSSVTGLSLLRADRGDLLGDVDADRAPGDAAAAADAARRAELIDPGGELVRHPLPVAGPVGDPHRATVKVGVVHGEAGIPGPLQLRLRPGQIGDVLDAEAEARRAGHGAVPAGQAPPRHLL